MIRFIGLFSLLLGLSVLSAQSQTLIPLKITPVEKPERIPVFLDYPESAGIIVLSSLSNLQVRSTLGIVADKSLATEGRYIWLVQPARQSLTISAEGYQSVSIAVSPNQAREVLYYRVEPEELKPVEGRGNFLITSEPAGANIIIDGFPDIKQKTPFTFINYSAQAYFIRLEFPKYETAEFILKVEEAQTLRKNVALVPTYGFLRLNKITLLDARRGNKSLASNEVDLRINGILQRYSFAKEEEFSVGNYTLEFSGKDIITKKMTIIIEPGETTILNPELEVNYNTQTYAVKGTQGVALFKTDIEKDVFYTLPDQLFEGNNYSRNFKPGTYSAKVTSGSYSTTFNFLIEDNKVSDLFIPLKPDFERAFALNLIPGLGQVYIHKKRGYIYSSLAIGFAAFGIYSYSNYLDSKNELDSYIIQYNQASDETSAVYFRDKVNETQKASDDNYAFSTYSAFAFLGTMGISYLDLMLFSPDVGWKKAKEVDSSYENILGASSLSPIAVKSLNLVPGLGHIAIGHERGWLYLGSFLGATSFAIYRNQTISDLQKSISETQVEYNSAVEEKDVVALRNSLTEKHSEENAQIKELNTALIVSGAIWGYSFLEGLFISPTYNWRNKNVSKSFSARIFPTYDYLTQNYLVGINLSF